MMLRRSSGAMLSLMVSLEAAGYQVQGRDCDVIPLESGHRIELDRRGYLTYSHPRDGEVRLDRTRIQGVDNVHLCQRLLRRTIHHGSIDATQKTVCLFENDLINVYETESGQLTHSTTIVGSRPLVVAYAQDVVVYGEYTRGRRAAVSLLASEDRGRSFYKVGEIASVRHIHGVTYDPSTGWFWITTGDNDHESAVWVMESIESTPQKVFQDRQVGRAVQLVLTDRRVFWGTDSPDQQNSFVSLDRETHTIQMLAEATGPVYYGHLLGDEAFFSTAVENRSHQRCVLYRLNIRTLSIDRIGEIQKDRMPMKFQYGTVILSGTSDYLALRLRSTKNSGSSVIVSRRCK